ncbi:MAG TPA: hypothetical protein VG248_16065 [Caulobacteraceae bacterium]|nr:hypothetical protein [Caulobacteraceae bacterium]
MARKRWKALAGAISLGAHFALVLLILAAVGKSPISPPTPPVTVEVLTLPLDAPAPAPWSDPAPPAPTPAPVEPAAARAVRPQPAPRASLARRAPSAQSELSAGEDASGPGEEAGVSDAELAGAARAGGAGGGACDMAARLEAALGKDRLVRTAVSGFSGRAVRVWNGDWVRSEAEDGKGLAAVREAIMWEVAFAPAACRSELVHGLVVVSVPGAQGQVRLALGGAQWRWSDLLGAGGR